MPVFNRPLPAFPMPHGQVTYYEQPTTHSDYWPRLPPRAQRSATMPIPTLRSDTSTHAPMPYPSYATDMQAPIVSHPQLEPYSEVFGATQIPTDHKLNCACSLQPKMNILRWWVVTQGHSSLAVDEEDKDKDNISAVDGGCTLPKGPASLDRPIAGIQKIKQLGEPFTHQKPHCTLTPSRFSETRETDPNTDPGNPHRGTSASHISMQVV